MIAEVAFAAADDESRPVFTGVMVQVGEKKITFAAADALPPRRAYCPAQ